MKPKNDPQPKPADPKVFDVTRPGKTPAPAASKPVIVGHKPQVQDPSVTVNGVGERRPLGGHKKIEVTSGTHMPPIEVPNEPEAPVKAEDIPETEVDALAEVAIEGVNDGQAAVEPELTAEAAPQIQPGAPRKPIAPLPENALAETTAAPDPEPQGIVVSDHAAQHSSAGKSILLVVIVILLAVAILNVLLDADMVKVEGLPHTDFL
jgi:hypothetical protein